MKKIILFAVLFFVFFSQPIFGQEIEESEEGATTENIVPISGPRFAVCDRCSYCPPNEPPQSWEKCRQCLYPNARSDPSSMDTLLIDPETNTPVNAAPGNYYTFIGCVSTGDNNSSFSDQVGTSNVFQKILNVVFSIAGGIAFLYLLYGAFIMATSQADPGRLNYGRRVITASIAGLIFSLMSVFIVNFIASQVLKIPGFSQ